jgi:hypothetical protein
MTMNTAPLPGVPDVEGASEDTGGLLPRLFGKCAGETPSSALENKHKEHITIYLGSGRDRGSRVKPYVQHV